MTPFLPADEPVGEYRDMLFGAVAARNLRGVGLNTGIAALKNGSSKLEPPIAGLRLAAPSAAVKVRSPFNVAEAPAVVTANSGDEPECGERHSRASFRG